MRPYKVLVVDDSAFMRKLVSDFVSEDPRFEIVATARDGVEALEKTKEYRPDVITMDVEMPKMNGLEALRRIMADYPTPVVMLSSLTSRDANETIQALERGAVDFVQKPSGSISLDLYKVKEELKAKVQMAVQAKVTKTVQTAANEPKQRKNPFEAQGSPSDRLRFGSLGKNIPKREHSFEHLIAIGTSTGGPKALQQVLTRLPEDFPAPIVIVQHMPPHFTRSLAKRLDSISEIRVKEATDGEPIEAGTAYIAPGGFHMTVIQERIYRVRITKESPRNNHRPSVDVLFESLLSFKQLKRHAVLMTGMGSDGAMGMQALKQSGAITCIAEAEETCIVYGMPRAAVELGCVDYILPLDAISSQLIQITRVKGTGFKSQGGASSGNE